MLFTIDRLQFIEDKLICFEFIDLENTVLENSYLKRYLNEKIQHLENSSFIDTFYLIQYSSSKVFIGRKSCRKEYSKEEFKIWFNQINNYSNYLQISSKKLGSATANDGDPYVQTLLNDIFTAYPEKGELPLNLLNDDNGLSLVKEALENTATFGFDFDLYDSINHSIIEFLKRDSPLVTNLTAHPARYAKNKKKFISLWKAAININSVSPCLYLVNYSDDYSEAISVIQILDFDLDVDSKIMVKSDIGYKLNNREDLFNWLFLLNTSPEQANTFLQDKPKEIRNSDFFENVYFNDGKKNIGINYI